MMIRTKLIAIFGVAIVVVATFVGGAAVTYHRMMEEGRAPHTAVAGEAAQAATQLEARQSAAERTLGATFLVMLLLVGVGCYAAMHVMVLRPLRHIVSDINAMSEGISEGRGDLNRRVVHSSSDELGILARCFNEYISRMQDIIREAQQSSSQLAAAAEQLSAVTDESRRSVQQQQSEVEQVATAMNEMTATVQEVARSTAHAAETARNTDEKTRHGIDAVTQAIEMIDDLAQEVRSAADAVHKLEEKSADIGKVVDVIRGIAEQTNLLALNAAIEAARAGEQGRGFAVVADEVRVLASRTQNSTREIQEMIQRLQNGTSEAAQVMLRGNEQAKVCVREAGKGASVLAEISGAVGKINDMNTQIASAAEEQGAVAEEINRNVTTISQIAGHTVGGVDQTASAAAELARMAARLQDLVRSFKV